MEANLDDMAPIGPLTEWLDANVPDLGKGPLKREMLHGGTSNVVFTLDRGGKPMVLRRPPAVPPPGAEMGVLREARVLTALNGTEVPHPICYGLPSHLLKLRGDGVVSSSDGGQWRV